VSKVTKVERYLNLLQSLMYELKELENFITDIYILKLKNEIEEDLIKLKAEIDKGKLKRSQMRKIYNIEGMIKTLSRLSNKRKRVFVGGTFDIIHPGHIELLKFASQYGDVYVTVARDVNVKKFKGREPILNEEERLEIIKSIRYVKEAILGDQEDILRSVEKIRPDYLILGPDQKIEEEKLKEELFKRGLENIKIIRMKERKSVWKHSSSSSIISDITSRFCK
jgi:FAD synthetase